VRMRREVVRKRALCHLRSSFKQLVFGGVRVADFQYLIRN